MILASLAGIQVFATGGIGGVHRGAEKTMDISADLQELRQTSVAVVCAGAKMILDIGLTLEYLETMGVPVLGLRTDDFPAFYCRRSGFGVDYNAKDEAEIARIAKTKWDLGLDVYMPSVRLARVNRSVNRTVTLPAWLNAAALERNVNFSQVLQDALRTQLHLG